MEGFTVNSTKVNITRTVEAGRITADIVLGSDVPKVENGIVFDNNGQHVASFSNQSTSCSIYFPKEMTPTQRLEIHKGIEEFMSGAVLALTESAQEVVDEIAEEAVDEAEKEK